MDYLKTLKRLSSLVAPLETSLIGHPEKTPEHWLNDLLLKKIKEISSDPLNEGEDVRWKFVEMSLMELQALRSQLREPIKNTSNDTTPLLSVHNQKVITSLLQLILGMGIVPYLIKGVGLPLEKRSKYVELFAKQKELPVEQKRIRTVFVINSLLDLSEGPEELAAIIITKNFGDILAALIQLGYAPLSKPNNEPPTSESEFHMTPELYESLTKESEEFREKYLKFINRVYQPLVVKYLLVLQSGKGVPRWVKETVGDSLTSRLLRCNGVSNVICGVLDVGGSEDDKKAKIIASVLASPPSTYSYGDVENYYELVCPQIIHILKIGTPTFKKIAVECIRGIADRSLTLSKRHLFGSLLSPLLVLTESPPESEEIPTEEDLSKCIDILHFLFVLGTDPSITFLQHLEPVIDVILHLHCAIVFGISHLRNSVQEILVRYLKYSTQEHSLTVIQKFAFGQLSSTDNDVRTIPIDKSMHFIPGDAGGMLVVKKDFDEESNFYVKDDEKSIAIVDLITSISRDLTLEFYMILVSKLTEIMSGKEFDIDLNAEELSTEKKLLQIESDLENTMSQLKKNLMIIRLLGLLSEDDTLQEDISKNSSRMIRFVSMTIERGAYLTQKRLSNDAEMDISCGVLESQSLSMALTIISIHLTQSRSIKNSDWNDLMNISDSFKILEDQYQDERIRSLAKKIRTFIFTRGVVVETTKDLQGKVKQIQDSTEKLKAMANTLKELEKEEKNRTLFQSALYDLSDPLLPVRGSGLIRLTQLLENKDEETMQNIDQLFNIFIQNLGDEDTYIYLSSINGLVAIGNKTSDPGKVLDRLLQEFNIISKRKDDVADTKIKLGEALVKITKLMGDVTPKFKNLLLNGFIAHLGDEEELVRSSVLSNLGEVCKNLNFSLGNDIEEIMMVLDNVLKLDKSLSVRRSAVHVIALIIEGLGKNIFTILKDKLKDIYRTLKNLEKNEKDEVLIHHAQKAIEEIDGIMKEFLNPGQSLKKTIYVLDAPPEPF
ncbi:transport and Golgi organization protein 6 homolog isoform X1 [Lepeophtheirus salmonis]|uniref:transport and Golgi organization protein 6 homolog isoform X1 n=2 Tax=Lepeophtheirus salmonis TaxID=72036 RepID=UPI001AE31E31|nr:transport and Golgi organization protein 6 homolog isoform X1 [Lepeophtheirus salmonis]